MMAWEVKITHSFDIQTPQNNVLHKIILYKNSKTNIEIIMEKTF